MLAPSMASISCAAILLLALAGCSKSSSDKAEPGSAAPLAPPPTATIDASAEPPPSSSVVGPTRSATGSLQLSGAFTGTFAWRKQSQRSPITCVWDAEKEIGTVRVDVSDEAGKIVTLAVDVPPDDVGLPRLEVSSKDLAVPLKTSLGFNVSGESGDDATRITVKLTEAKLGEDEAKPDLTITGTIEVSCPKKK